MPTPSQTDPLERRRRALRALVAALAVSPPHPAFGWRLVPYLRRYR